MTGEPLPRDAEANRLLVERSARGAESESPVARALAWTGRSVEDHAAELARALALADAIVRGRGFPSRREPLPSIRVRGQLWRPRQ